ncbi:MAG: leucine-rich repeat domain-containing protein, partial [Gemmatimonadota bacterium]|nr:leucine-rich repeat domain-containing protein [Gemmatimonadota bacterium]
MTVNAGESSSVTACFTDANGDMLSYTATSSNTAVATVSISGTSITVAGVAPGNASVTVTATDPGGLQAQQSFQVMVPNRAPQRVGTIPALTVRVGDAATVDVSPYFSDPDGDSLTYTASSSNTTVATVAVAGDMVYASSWVAGSATLTVTATDPGGLFAETTVSLTVLGGVCDRTPQVRDRIVRVTGAASCGAVTDAAIAGIRSLRLEGRGIMDLQEGDFAGLSGLDTLALHGNALTILPTRVFAGLSNLEVLTLYGNRLWTLPAEVFAGLSNLEVLALSSNRLWTLPAEVFAGLSNLQVLNLAGNEGNNDLTTLPPGVLAGLSSLAALYLDDNGLTTLPAGVFAGLSELRWLGLSDNDLTGPIPRELGSLSNLELLRLDGNALAGAIPSELGNLSKLQTLSLFNNGRLSGPLPLALESLPLRRFRYYATNLCVPEDASFRAWLDAISEHEGTGVDCLRRLTDNSADDRRPEWNDDGEKIAFESYRGGDSE